MTICQERKWGGGQSDLLASLVFSIANVPYSGAPCLSPDNYFTFFPPLIFCL
jgi:hypothetical protein